MSRPTAIRVVVNAANDNTYSRVIEIEAFSCTPIPVSCVNPGGTGGCFNTIQGAINASSPGDQVNVQPGTYDEDVNVNKAA
jgi:pectin methylesterase-like acyl-CoA thioesterase